MAVIEFARNVLGLKDANSVEIDKDTPENVIDIMLEQKKVKDFGATMRLGAFPCTMKSGSKIAEIYGSTEVTERHRHRYEVNNKYISALEEKGLVISGKNEKLDLVESIELPDHPWFIAVQSHPEFKSKPGTPHPLFRGFVDASYKNKTDQ